MQCVYISAGDAVQNGDEVEQLCKSASFQEQACGSCVSVLQACKQPTSSSFFLQAVGESESLEERLLCVESTEMSVNIAILIMQAVASVSSFVGFLPLGNRASKPHSASRLILVLNFATVLAVFN